jgi:hypothetical protein
MSKKCPQSEIKKHDGAVQYFYYSSCLWASRNGGSERAERATLHSQLRLDLTSRLVD